MKKNKLFWLIALLLMITVFALSAQSTEAKLIGPVTILSPEQPVVYPQTDFNVAFAASPLTPPRASVVRIYGSVATPWAAPQKSSFSLAAGEISTLPFTIEWAYIPPAGTVVKNIGLEIVPDDDYSQMLTDPAAIIVSVTKPAGLNQRKLAIIREGSPALTVVVQQSAPVAGHTLLNNATTDFYFDYGGTVMISAPRPTPSPCGSSCAQAEFLGISGDLTVPGTFSPGVSVATLTMDADKQIVIRYTMRPGLSTGSPSGTPTPPPTGSPSGTPPPTNIPYLGKGDVNASGKVDIMDALLVAKYSAGIYVAINWTAADVNCDTYINITDALLIARYSAGLSVEFCKD